MKTLLTLVLLHLTLLADGYTIQVLYANNPASVTDALLKKIKQLKQPYAIDKQPHYCRVFVGTPTSEKAARNMLPTVQKQVTADAFLTKRSWECSAMQSPCVASANASNRATTHMQTNRSTMHEQTQQKDKTGKDKTDKDKISMALEYFRTSGYYHFQSE